MMRENTPFLTVHVPGNPIGKARPRILRSGRSYTPGPTKAWEEAAAVIARAAMRGAPVEEGALYVYVRAWMPIPVSWSKKKQLAATMGIVRPTVKPDGDNILKIVGDALNGVVWKDDAQLVEQTIVKAYARETSVVIHVGRL